VYSAVFERRGCCDIWVACYVGIAGLRSIHIGTKVGSPRHVLRVHLSTAVRNLDNIRLLISSLKAFRGELQLTDILKMLCAVVQVHFVGRSIGGALQPTSRDA
jgi:hypothetical protein